MYIEDLIHFATGSGPYLFKSNRCISDPKDFEVLSSMGDQLLFNSNQLTEKQGHLAVKLLNKYRIEMRPFVPTLDNDLDNPKWKNPFRVLPRHKRISIGNHEQPAKFHNGKCILIEFPYDDNIVNLFRSHNTEMHELYKGGWDANLKQWVFALTEKNVEWLGDNLLSKDFYADDQFQSLYQEIKAVIPNMESHIPMITASDNGYTLINVHRSVPSIETGNLVEALFLAREYGITTWDDTIDAQINQQLSPVTKTILSVSNKKHPWIDSDMYSVDVFQDLIQYGGPALVIIPGGSELEMITVWTEFVLRMGIQAEQMSVMFRLPNDQAEFNQFVKTAKLNNPISENTRLVFVSTKITKPLIKAGIEFNTVINLGYYNYMHFTMSTVVDNARNLVYYSMKAPTKNNKWQPREL
jgi:hypothetical protein